MSILLCLPPPKFFFPFPYSAPPNTHMRTLTEAVVLFDYAKQEDDELSLKVGYIITDVKQVCAACCIVACCTMYVCKLNQVTGSNLQLVSSAASWYHLVCMRCFG